MAQIQKDPGIGYKTNKNAQKMIEHGKPNVKHINRARTVDDLYTYLINIPWWLFLLYVLLGYILVNGIFASIYFWLCLDDFDLEGSFFHKWLQLFYFSAQTVTTVGYGLLSPKHHISGVISTLEALVGLMSFSFITGLLYGRFSKPKAKVKFSNEVVIREYKEGKKALMFRLMNHRKNMMIQPQIHATINIKVADEQGEFKRTFYQLSLERDKILFLPTMWTLVHVIDKESPLYGYSDDELKDLEVEIYVLFQYHEEAFNQSVYQLHSYDFSNLKTGYKFGLSYSFDEEGYTLLDHEKLNEIIKM